MLKLLRSFSFRLALSYMALFGLSMLSLMVFIYWFTAAYMLRESDNIIETEINELADHYDMLGLDGLKLLIDERTSHRHRELSIYLLTAQDYKKLAGNLDAWPEASVTSQGWIDFSLISNEQGNRIAQEVRARRFTLPGGYHLLVGRIVSELVSMEARIAITLAWGLGLMLFIGGLLGWWMSRRMTRRIEAINRTNREIINGDLSRRIPLQGSNDELERLAISLNEMLDRIQILMEDVRRVSDNIAHDLRTPLGHMHNQLDNLHHELQQAGLDTSSVEQALNESQRLLTTFNALLRIARIEARSRTDGFTTVDLTALLYDVVEYYEPLAEVRHQALVVSAAPEVQLPGDRDLLFQAIANLLDNAIKYAPQGSEIQLSLTTTELTISDTGPGIPTAARQKIFQRFFRLEASRSTPGSGLGLSLVEAVARLHGMSIRVFDNAPGSRFSLGLRIFSVHEAQSSPSLS